jgi:arsenite-transporting ATPase
VLKEVGQSFVGLPVWEAEYQPAEPVGAPALAGLARRLYGDDDPLIRPEGEGPFRVTREPGGAAELHLALPFVTRAEVDLARNGDELVVTVGSSRRLLTLPAGLSRLRVAGARVEAGELTVRFREPDPAPHSPSREGVR